MIFDGELYRDDVNKISYVLGSYRDFLDTRGRFPDLESGTWGGRGATALFGDLGVKGITKAHAIDRLLAHLGANRQDTVAFGDAAVDIPMLEYCAVGVAMGNGSEDIKALGGDTATISNVLPNTWMGGNGIISAIIMGLIGSWVYTTCIKKNLRIKMPDAVPEGVSNAFSAMIPGFFIMCYSAIIYQVCQVFGGVSLTELIFKIIQTPMQGLTDNWAGAIIIVLLMSLLFWCGLHGPNIVSGIIYPVLTANSLVNQNLMDQGIKATQANGGHYLVPQLIDCFCKFGGVGLTLGFIVAALLVAKSAQVRELSKLSLVPGIFNVNEPMIFGLPIVYNPIMLIPFICAPLVAVILTYGAMVIGFLPAFGAMQVPWTTPPIISGFLLGGWQGVVIQVLIFAASIAIWFPFVKMQDKICLKQEQDAAAE